MLHIILYQPEIPANTGNIMRTCKACGASLHIIGPIKFSLDEKSLKRAGMDYIEGLSLTIYESYEDFLSRHPNADIYYVTRYGENVYSNNNFSRIEHSYYVMFGKESTGIPHEILRNNLDKCLRIPMLPSARSLNLSNCVALVTYEILRQQNFYGLSSKEMIKGDDFLINEEK